MRGFTLLEITICVVVVGVVSAMAGPSIHGAIQAKRRTAVGEKVQTMVGAARDVARTRLDCVTVAPIEPCDGEIGVATYAHACPVGTNDPTMIDGNGNLIPDDVIGMKPAVLIEKFVMDPALVAAVEVRKPDVGCDSPAGTASPPSSCYTGTNWFQYRADGTTTAPFQIVINGTGGAADTLARLTVQPGSGSIRAAD